MSPIQEEEKSKREELEKILEENNRKIAEAQAKLVRSVDRFCSHRWSFCWILGKLEQFNHRLFLWGFIGWISSNG